MSEEHQNTDNTNLPVATGARDESQDLGDAWREVGDQFQQLGGKLADALKRSWSATEDDQQSREKMRRLRDDLRAAAERVDQVIDETRDERQSTMHATRRASEQSLEEARVLTAATLRKLNKQLDHLVQRLEGRD